MAYRHELEGQLLCNDLNPFIGAGRGISRTQLSHAEQRRLPARNARYPWYRGAQSRWIVTHQAASGQFIHKNQKPDWTQNSVATPVHLNIEITNFLAQGVAVHSQEIGGPDLVAARCSKRGRQ